MKRNGNIKVLIMIAVAILAIFIWGNTQNKKKTERTTSNTASTAVFRSSVTCHKIRDRILFTIKIFNEKGERLRRISRSTQRLIGKPLVKVFDSSGQEIHSFRVGYG